MTYFAFVSQYFQDQSINIVGFDLCYPFFMMLLDISCVLLSYVKLCYIIQHLRHVDNEKVGYFNVEPHHVCLGRLLGYVRRRIEAKLINWPFSPLRLASRARTANIS